MKGKPLFGVMLATSIFTASPAISSSLIEEMVPGDTIPHQTGMIVIDDAGKSWNIDSILDAGKVLAVHQTFST